MAILSLKPKSRIFMIVYVHLNYCMICLQSPAKYRALHRISLYKELFWRLSIEAPFKWAGWEGDSTFFQDCKSVEISPSPSSFRAFLQAPRQQAQLSWASSVSPANPSQQNCLGRMTERSNGLIRVAHRHFPSSVNHPLPGCNDTKRPGMQLWAPEKRKDNSGTMRERRKKKWRASRSNPPLRRHIEEQA